MTLIFIFFGGQIETAMNHRSAVHHVFRISGCHGPKKKRHRPLLLAVPASDGDFAMAPRQAESMNLKDQWVATGWNLWLQGGTPQL